VGKERLWCQFGWNVDVMGVPGGIVSYCNDSSGGVCAGYYMRGRAPYVGALEMVLGIGFLGKWRGVRFMES